MHDVIGINFESGNRIYYFSVNKLNVKKNDKLVVETERGLQFCVAVTDIMQIPDSKVVTPLRPILRIATKDDIKKAEENKKICKEAIEKARKISNDLKLDMKFIDCSYTLDRNQLVYVDGIVAFTMMAVPIKEEYYSEVREGTLAHMMSGTRY